MLMILNPKSIGEVIARFVIKKLLTISGELEYDPLNRIIQEVYANATTLPTTLACKKHVHVVLIMKKTLNVTLTTVTPCEVPDEPCTSPTIATNVTVYHWQHTNETYGKVLQFFEKLQPWTRPSSTK